jgi:hypothetical protein
MGPIDIVEDVQFRGVDIEYGTYLSAAIHEWTEPAPWTRIAGYLLAYQFSKAP